MLLKRIYDHSSGTPKLTHVQVKRANKIQKFSTKFVEQQTAAGILSLGNGRIVLKTADGEPDLAYRIIRGPGLYCTHCDQPQGDSAAAAVHVVKEHAGKVSPDPNNPSGYRKDNFYLSEKIS